MRGVIVGILFGACALIAVMFLSGPIAPPVSFEAILGAPGPHSPSSRSPGLAMDVAFSGDGSRVVARQENGDIVAWGLATTAPHLLGQTNGPFAYCAAKDMLAVGDDAGITVTSLNNGRETRRFGEAAVDHAAISADCSILAVAAEAESQIQIWTLKPQVGFRAAKTKRPVRNGLAIAPDGLRLAAATGVYSDASGHDAGLETFAVPPWGPTTAGATVDGDLIVGMWRIAFSPDGATLFTGSQAEAQAGLRAFAASDASPIWGYDGFEAYWVRGLAVSPDGAIVATGDEKGMLRLWSASDGAMLYEGSTGLVIQSLAFSGDGSKLAVGLWDATIGVASVEVLVGEGL